MSDTTIGFGFKVVFVGNSGVGKTAAVQRFCTGRVPEVHVPSLSAQFYERTFELADAAEAIDLMIWDTPGRENLHRLAADSFQNANVCVVVYSCTDRESFDTVPQWVEKVKAVSVDAQVVLVENKVDLMENSRVMLEEGQRMSSQLEAPLFRVSVKEGLNLRPLFQYVAVRLHKRFLSSLNSLPLGADVFFMANVDDRMDGERSTSDSTSMPGRVGTGGNPDRGDQVGWCAVA